MKEPDTELVWVEGDDGRSYQVPAPVARKLVWASNWAGQIVALLDHNEWPADSALPGPPNHGKTESELDGA